MTIKKNKEILINILVVCLYFLWPYLLNASTELFNLSETAYLYVSFSMNFIFLFIVIYIYNGKIKKYLIRIGTDFRKKLFISAKIFIIGLIMHIIFNYLLLDISSLSNQNFMIKIFKKIPIMFVLNTLFYYPVIEELVFKMSFKEIFKNKWSFIIFTGVFNALFQIVFSFNNLTDLLYLLPLTALSSSLSYIYYKTDNIIYPILLRMCYNLIPCIIYIIDLFH